MSTPKTLDEAFLQTNQKLFDTFIKKHRDYGKGNILSIKELGIAYRLTEKVERLKHLLTNTSSSPENESIDDTLIDIAVYAIIARLYRQGYFQQLEVDPQILSSKP